MNHAEAVRSSAVERYLLDEMSELERHTFEDHFFECGDCAEEVRVSTLMRDGAKAGLLERSNVAPFAASKRSQPPGRAGITTRVLPWAIAAMVGFIAVYQSLPSTRVSGRLSPQALQPVTLRPDSRGTEPTVEFGPQASVITLAVDVGTAGGATELTYDLRDTGGRTVASGRATAPSDAAPLLLLVPVWTVSPAQHYILSIRRQVDGQLLDEYRFGVARH